MEITECSASDVGDFETNNSDFSKKGILFSSEGITITITWEFQHLQSVSISNIFNRIFQNEGGNDGK